MHKAPQFDVYLAGPFFSVEQKIVMDAAKSILYDNGLTVLDPRDLNGVIVEDAELRKEDKLQKIFEDNVKAMHNSFAIVACIDDRDTGTAFELGYFYSLHRIANSGPILTFSARGYGCNVMLARATHGHFQDLKSFTKDGEEYFIFDAIHRRDMASFLGRMGILLREREADRAEEVTE